MADSESSWEVAFYEAVNGSRPAEEWYRSLPAKAQARFARTFELLEEHGTNVTRPHVDQVRGKIWEVRVEHMKVQHRLLYFAAPERRFVMLHGLTKAQKVPQREIDVAEQRMKDYTARWQEGRGKKGG